MRIMTINLPLNHASLVQHDCNPLTCEMSSSTLPIQPPRHLRGCRLESAHIIPVNAVLNPSNKRGVLAAHQMALRHVLERAHG
jgi:hypothetical protein